jgi:MFS family permease
MGSLVHNRNAVVYLSGQALSLFGDSALWLAAGIWVKTLTGSNSAAGLLFFVFALPQLAAPMGGLLADRIRRRPLLIATNLATGAALLLLLAVHSRHQIWLICLVMAVYGASASILGAAGSAVLTVILPTDQLAAGNSALHTIRGGLRLVAPLIGASLYTWYGPAVVAVLDAATFAVAAASLAALRIHEPRPARSGERIRTAMMAGWAHIRTTSPLRQLVVATALLFTVVGFSETLIYAIVDNGLHRPPTFVGVLLIAQGAGAILAGLTATATLRRWRAPAVAATAIAAFAASALLSATPWLATVLTGITLFGASLGWLIIATTTLLQRSTSAHLQARVYATTDLLTKTPQIASIALGAALLTVLDYRTLLLATATVAVSTCIYLRLTTRRPPAGRDPSASETSACPAPTSTQSTQLWQPE